ncbi:MAG: hypothetical protein FWE86_04510 [Oscillospiraceae bacterium]|nr:hypothetical protein [Oscillospiraceae bacterium]
MTKRTMKAYVFLAKCPVCRKIHKVYYDLADFYEGHIFMKCRNCGELYFYDPEEEHYLRSFNEQIKGKRCCTCNKRLSKALIPIHKEIRCSGCGGVFSLEDGFAGNEYPPDESREEVDVYRLYS